MKIIIPMTGYGSRFVAKGYKDLKPLIKVQGKPIIEWIVKYMYPGESDFLFICRKEHLDNIPELKDTLKRIAPTSQIYEIEEWIKKGPVYDVMAAKEAIADNEPCIINYCDFFMIWNWNNLKEIISENKYDGIIPCYSGFHPHLLHEKNVYASCLVNDDDNLVEIKEKYSFEKNKLIAKHSPGVYFFKSGKVLKKYCNQMINNKDELNGEYYASLVYNYMVKDGLKVFVPINVDFFCQWGTPEDLEEYLYWTNIIKGVD